jgi:hypothetical protein
MSPFRVSVVCVVCACLLVPVGASAQGPMTNGAIHEATIASMGETDVWTFTASQGDSIFVNIGEVGPDTSFMPWIQLENPSGVLMSTGTGALAVQLSAIAPVTGVYTVRVGDAGQDGSGAYRLTLAAVPGIFTVSGGDEGGAIATDGTPSPGTIYRGDIDVWTFTALAGVPVSARITETVSGGVDTGFAPWIMLFGPGGTAIASRSGESAAQIDTLSPASGVYTLVVRSADSGSDGEGSYDLAVQVSTVDFRVTTSTGANGSLSPGYTQVVPGGTKLTFTVTAALGYEIAAVTGCGGTLTGTQFSTGGITENCTVAATFKPIVLPTLSLDKTALSFGIVSGAAGVLVTPAQVVRLVQGGEPNVSWTVTSTQPWLHVSPSSGMGTADLTVSVSSVPSLATTPLSTGHILFGFTAIANNPGSIQVAVRPALDMPALGTIDTPTDNRTGVTGAVPFTGWAVDDIGVARVAICRAAVVGEFAPVDPNCGGAAEIFIGFAVTIDGARPDVAAAFPGYPANTFGGWGLMVLTNMLPNQGNGTYVFHAYAQDLSGRATVLGTRTMTCANAQATLPFGAIDTPALGGTASGSSYVNFGWALTPQPKTIPTDGSTITVLVDGLSQGHVTYNNYRPDVATLFPGLSNSNGAIGFKVLDTTALANGTHTIVWVVTDDQGATEGIGSRFFTVSNSSAMTAAPPPASADAASLALLPLSGTPVASRRGWDLTAPFETVPPGTSGQVIVRAEEVDRVELRLAADGRRTVGYLRSPDGLAALPIGSSLDEGTGTFTWAPGVGFVGNYDFVFVMLDGAMPVTRHEVRIVLQPKGRGAVGPQVVIDIPTKQQDVGQPFMLAGWAADLGAMTGTGISTVHVWAYPLTREAPIFLGVADTGRRPDVATLYGAQFADAGYGLIVDGLTPGNYDLAVFAASAITGDFLPASVVRVTVR